MICYLWLEAADGAQGQLLLVFARSVLARGVWDCALSKARQGPRVRHAAVVPDGSWFKMHAGRRLGAGVALGG